MGSNNSVDQRVGETTRYCEASIKGGSLSFSLATSLLPRAKRRGVHWLYAWCRHCDDSIDSMVHASAYEKSLRLAELHGQLRAASNLEPVNHPAHHGFLLLMKHYSLPPYYAHELLNGMEMDIHKARYQNFRELELYCYRVAGVVGLMSCHIMGIKDVKALEHAEALGNAMQLTNIARDVFDDFQLGRVYLPQDWMHEAGLDGERLVETTQREALVAVVERLLRKADDYYEKGAKGISYLPFPCAVAVLTARYVYADIGRIVRRRGARAWDKRAWVSMPRKLLWTAYAIGIVLSTVPSRLWQRTPTNKDILAVRRQPWLTQPQ